MKKLSVLLLAFVLIAISPFVTMVSLAAHTLDELGNGEVEYASEDDIKQEGTGDESADSITDYMQNYNPVTQENMDKASGMTSTVTNLIGYAIGIVLILGMALIGLITALDLLYIGVPFVRKFLNPDGGQQAAPQGMPGGYGRMGAMGGQAQVSTKPRWISDEALAALAEAGSVDAGAGGMGQQMRSPYGGGSYGGGPYGGGGYGAQMGGGTQQVPKTKSVILTYLKKRVVFLILFAVCSIILFSSVFTDCGINIAKLGMKVFGMINNGIDSVEIG